MSQHSALSASSLDGLAMLGIAAVSFWLPLTRVSVRDLGARAALTVSGYLRPRPDPATEQALRAAFAELDGDLAEILGDRRVHGRADRC
ncbi:hypothetical protein EAS64_39285 [Trebonia kvetii]|uniref:Uncharacterized protein n=1 Tax=Trebonia kvetii TaxID=2480626 RepID=A0A6P2BNL2_9ACTN|nr:hypothetical protein [Trebonia kvetii]TVZ00111.1 hypothetical protein EAS64_39285 [Trebonia kvetii]